MAADRGQNFVAHFGNVSIFSISIISIFLSSTFSQVRGEPVYNIKYFLVYNI